MKTLDSSFEFIPQNPFSIEIPEERNDDNVAYPGFPVEEKSGFLETAVEEFKEQSSLVQGLSGAERIVHEQEKPTELQQHFLPESSLYEQFQYRPAPAGWTPKSEIEKQTNITPKYMPRLLEARNPQDFQYRLDDVKKQMDHDRILENGSTMAKILGGLVGLSPIGSIENFIPLASIATKGKIAAGFMNNVTRFAPGITAASAIRQGAIEMNKVEHSLPEFIKNTFVDAAFGTVFFGAIGAGKTLLNVFELERLKDFSKAYLDGIGFDFVVDEKGNLKGFKAVDTNREALSAAKVTKAQEMADAAFYKGGLFKVPYLGNATLHLVSGNIPGFKYFLGSPLVQLKISEYKAANAFADSAFDHFLTTEGEAKGGTRAPSFELKMKMTKAALTRLRVETAALHSERNGYSLESRPAIGIQNAWAAMKQKSIETLSKETRSTDYVSHEDFMDEVQRVLYSEESSPHASVNEAANMYRKVIDDTWSDFRTAHNLPENWLPPRTAAGYLMRVYDTKFLNENEGLWHQTITQWLTEADAVIEREMQPIEQARQAARDYRAKHEELIRSGKATNEQITASARELEALSRRTRKLKNDLANRMKSDRNLFIHAEDANALSANEAKEIKKLLKPIIQQQKKVDALKREVADLQKKEFMGKGKATRKRNAGEASEKMNEADQAAKMLEQKKEELRLAKDEVINQQELLQEKIADGQVKPNLYMKIPDSQRFILKDPKNLVKFRKMYESDFMRQQASKAYYDSIMHMHPEDVISDVFGKLTGKSSENVLKSRTLMIPDEILYQNNFLTKDLYAKTANYVNYLSRRTHLKTSFQNVTVNGDFNELAEALLEEYKSNRSLINERIAKLQDEKASPKEIEKEKKKLRKEATDFAKIKDTMRKLYETRMMGIGKRDDVTDKFRRGWMAITSAVNLHNLPATQVTDLAFGGFQHGIWPYVRDGIYPLIESLGGILKTENAQALREMAPHLNLGLQDVGNNYASKNWHNELQPYINMGKWAAGIEKFSHFSSLTDLSPYIDNGIQRLNGSVIQSRFMELLFKHAEGNLSEKESLYLRKYGIDPNQWSERMTKAFKDANGIKTKLGGYLSKSWQWQDLEAANVFNTAVFRGIQNTLIWKGMADSPFFADHILGMFLHTFSGWGYAAANRYLIPSMQHPDGELVLKMLWMAGAGAFVSPMRRIARGEEPWPDDMTEKQIAYEVFSDSGIFSTGANVLNIANFLTQDKLLGDLKNDKFRNRVRTGIFGIGDVVSSTASRVSDVLGMAASGDFNEKDLKTAAHMLPITGAMYGHYVSDKLIESFNLPRNRRIAENS